MATSSAVEKSASTRRRKFSDTSQSGDDVGGTPTPQVRKVSLTNAPLSPKRRTWRTYVRWTARILLVLVVILSSARVVRIPGRSSETVLLIMTHSRADYLSRCLESVLSNKYRNTNSHAWDILVSRDRADGRDHSDVDAVLRKHSAHLSHIFSHQPEIDPGTIKPAEASKLEPDFVDESAYRRISAHYKYAISAAFARDPAISRVVILEDDMLISHDFFNYFERLTPVLEHDDTLWCVSSWNDNGLPGIAKNASQLFRTDFFPGLGWMLTRELWENELRDIWPQIFWDDWMRNPEVSKGRQCIRPEVSRTENFGEHGVSASMNFATHIGKVQTLRDDNDNKNGMDEGMDYFDGIELAHYLAPDNFEKMFFTRMANATLLKYSNYLTSRPQDGDVIAKFPPGRPYAIGKRTGIMTDHRFGTFRTSYKGVIVIAWNGYWAFIVPMDFRAPDGYSLGARECC